MFTESNLPFASIVRTEDLTFIIAKRPAKKGLFTYHPLADLDCIDSLLMSSIDFSDERSIRRLFAGLCPLREASGIVCKVSKDPRRLLEELKSIGLIKDQKPTKVELASYRLKDGYRISLLQDRDEIWLVEHDQSGTFKSRCLSLREGKARLKATIDRIEQLEGVQFMWEKPL